jgi:hypothetical protein
LHKIIRQAIKKHEVKKAKKLNKSIRNLVANEILHNLGKIRQIIVPENILFQKKYLEKQLVENPNKKY